MHSARLLDHFQNPRNVGAMDGASAVVESSNPVCGDILKLWAAISGGRIVRMTFQCRGCVASIACGSALTELAAGKTIAEARAITPADIEAALDGLESASKHAAVLAVDTLKKLVTSLKVQ